MKLSKVPLVVLATIVLSVAGFLVVNALLGRPAAPQEAASATEAQPAGLAGPESEPINYQLAVDDTVVSLNFVPQSEARTLTERPVAPAAPEAQPTLEPVESTPVVETEPQPTPDQAQDNQAVQPTAPPVQPAPVYPVTLVSYQVQGGDTLYSVASKNSTSVSLMAEYGLDSSDIVAGNLISVPVANPDFCPGLRTYVVKEGDTAYSIGRRLGTTHQAIQQANGLDAEYHINAGQVLCIP